MENTEYLDSRYLRTLLLGRLSYNPNYVNDSGAPAENVVCYFYPYYVLENNVWKTIDNVMAFPTVGRVSIRTVDSTADYVHQKYGDIVCACINRDSLQASVTSNNHFCVRFSISSTISNDVTLYSLKKSRVSFFEVIDTPFSTDTLLKRRPDIMCPEGFTMSTQQIMLKSGQDYIGPFLYAISREKDDAPATIVLKAPPENNFKAGVYAYEDLRGSLLDVFPLQFQPNITVRLLAGDPQNPHSELDFISDEELFNLFLDRHKNNLQLSRKKRSEIKSTMQELLQKEQPCEIDPERVKRLHRLLQSTLSDTACCMEPLKEILSNRELLNGILHGIPAEERLSLVKNLMSVARENAQGLAPEATIAPSQQRGVPAAAPSHPESMPSRTDRARQDVTEKTAVTYSQSQLDGISNMLLSLQKACKTMLERADAYLKHYHMLQQHTANGEHRIDMCSLISSPYYHEEIFAHTVSDIKAFIHFIENLFVIYRLDQSDEHLNDSERKIKKSLRDTLRRLKHKLNTLTSAKPLSEFVFRNLKTFDDDNNIVCNNYSLTQLMGNGKLVSRFFMAPFVEFFTSNPEHGNILSLMQKKRQLGTEVSMLEHQKEQYEKDLEGINNSLKEMVSAEYSQYRRAAEMLRHEIFNSVMGGLVPHSESAGSAAATAATAARDAASDNVKECCPNQTSVDEMPHRFDTGVLDRSERLESREEFISMLLDFFRNSAERNVSRNDLINYMICISQGFITTFAGEPGSGKTSMCYLLASALGLIREDGNNRFAEISVERGWTSIRDFIGYYNPLTKKLEKSNAAIFDAFRLLDAEARAMCGDPADARHLDPALAAPYFILLDEANLSPIEHYWAAFFSKCDNNTRSQNTLSLGGTENWHLPDNLRFLATINFDHTTEELSPRFLDRSWIIMLNTEHASIDFEQTEHRLRQRETVIPFEVMCRHFTRNEKDAPTESGRLKLNEIIEAFSQAELPLQPRSLKMVYNYMSVAASCMQQNEAGLTGLDYAVAQKILPTINGSGYNYASLIDRLLELCDKDAMPLSYKHLSRIKKTGENLVGIYQFFSR